MSHQFTLNFADVDRLQDALLAYQGDNAEEVINDVLHNDGAALATEAIYRLMPMSGKKKGQHAKKSKSLKSENGNLSVTIVASGKWHYLYFPDDGTNTRRHVGDQQFFRRGAESVQDEIINRCINRLTTNFE